MRIHLYTSWDGLLNYREGKSFWAWDKRQKKDTDFHIDLSVTSYNITRYENGDCYFTKRTIDQQSKGEWDWKEFK